MTKIDDGARPEYSLPQDVARPVAESLQRIGGLFAPGSRSALVHGALTEAVTALSQGREADLAPFTSLERRIGETLAMSPNDSTTLRPAMGMTYALSQAYQLLGKSDESAQFRSASRGIVERMESAACRSNSTNWIEGLEAQRTDQDHLAGESGFLSTSELAQKVREGRFAAALTQVEAEGVDPQDIVDELERQVSPGNARAIAEGLRRDQEQLPGYVRDGVNITLIAPLISAGHVGPAADCVLSLKDVDPTMKANLGLELTYQTAAYLLSRNQQ